MKNFIINHKGLFILLAVLIAFAVMIGGMFISANNKSVTLEEQIQGAKASIKVQEKRRVDLIYNLVDTVESYAKYEKETLTVVTEARKQVQDGNIEEATLTIQAVGEAYPELKSNENYKQFMTELAITENMIAEHRNNYNIQVKAYNKFCRKFPNNFILNIMGYEKIDVTYTEYNAPSDAPQDLFNKD